MFRLLRLSALLALAAGFSFAQDATDIVRRSLEIDSTNWQQAKDYTYQERTEQHEYDKKGNLRSSKSETRDVLILYGRPYRRLIARNDQALSPAEEKKEQQRLESESARRQREPASEKARFEKRRADERKFLAELPAVYQFRLVGQEQFDGRPVYVVQAEPTPGYRPHDRRTNIMTKMRGTLWIDKADYHWVKVDAETTDGLSFGLFLFRLAPGAHMIFEQTRINSEVWLPQRAQVKAAGRIGLVKAMRLDVDIAYRNYRKFQADSRIITTQRQ